MGDVLLVDRGRRECRRVGARRVVAGPAGGGGAAAGPAGGGRRAGAGRPGGDRAGGGGRGPRGGVRCRGVRVESAPGSGDDRIVRAGRRGRAAALPGRHRRPRTARAGYGAGRGGDGPADVRERRGALPARSHVPAAATVDRAPAASAGSWQRSAGDGRGMARCCGRTALHRLRRPSARKGRRSSRAVRRRPWTWRRRADGVRGSAGAAAGAAHAGVRRRPLRGDMSRPPTQGGGPSPRASRQLAAALPAAADPRPGESATAATVRGPGRSQPSTGSGYGVVRPAPTAVPVRRDSPRPGSRAGA